MMHKTWLCCLVLMRLTSAVPVTYQQRPQIQYVDEAGNPVDYQPGPQAAQPQPQQLVARYQPQPQPQYQPQPQPQPQQYRVRQPAPGLPQQQQQQRAQLPEDYDPNPQYQFSFDVRDDQFTNYQNRKEQREGDKISGSYSVVDSDGFIRTVKYTADPLEGFKAQVTREPTDIVVKLPQPPAAAPLSLSTRQQPQQQVYQPQQQQQQQVYQPQQINLQQQAYQQQQQRDSAGVVADLESVARQQLQAQARAQQQFALGVQPPKILYQQ